MKPSRLLPLLVLAAAARAQSPCALPDDTPDLPALAPTVAAGAALARTFERQYDRDLFLLQARPDHAYTVRVIPSAGGGLADGELRVFQSDASTLVGRTSSSGARTFAEIQVPASGFARRFYLDARPFAEYSQGTYTLSIVDTPPADGDGDGLPAAWETANGLNDADPGGTAPFTNGPNGDPDGDGATNFQEWLAGTNPTSAASVLRIRSLEFNLLRDGKLRWSAPQYARYVVYRATDLSAPVWVAVGTHIQADASGTAVFTDPDADAFPNRTYRIEFEF